MANTQKTTLSYTFQDELGTEASLAIYSMQDPTNTLANAVAEWGAIGADLNAVSGATITRGKVSLPMDAIAAGGVSKSGGRVEQNGVLNYLVTASGRHHGVAVPAWLDSLIVGGQIDLTGVTATLTAALTGAIANGAGVMTSSDFLALGALSDAFLSFRKHRRQLSRSSLELP